MGALAQRLCRLNMAAVLLELSFQTLRDNKIIIKNICSGDSTVTMAEKKVHTPPPTPSEPYSCLVNNVITDSKAAVRSPVTRRDQMTLQPEIISFVCHVDTNTVLRHSAL